MLEAKNLVKAYKRGTVEVPALRGVDFRIFPGEYVAIMGASGSGKTTLLQIMGTLDKPDQGEVLFEGENLHVHSDIELSLFRRRKMGFVFQSFNLLANLTALENIAWPLLLDGKPKRNSLEIAKSYLENVGLGKRENHFPAQLSGGEMQRVAIARALVSKPQIILADEPTGNLDSRNGEEILELLMKSLKSQGGALLMVTHDSHAASKCDRTITLKDGILV